MESMKNTMQHIQEKGLKIGVFFFLFLSFGLTAQAQNNTSGCGDSSGNSASCTISDLTFFPINGAGLQHEYVSGYMSATVNPNPVFSNHTFTVSGFAPAAASCGNGHSAPVYVSIGGQTIPVGSVPPYTSVNICKTYTTTTQTVQVCKPSIGGNPIGNGAGGNPGDGDAGGGETCTPKTITIKQCTSEDDNIPAQNETDITNILNGYINGGFPGAYVVGINPNPNNYSLTFTAPSIISSPSVESLPIVLSLSSDFTAVSYANVTSNLYYLDENAPTAACPLNGQAITVPSWTGTPNTQLGSGHPIKGTDYQEVENAVNVLYLRLGLVSTNQAFNNLLDSYGYAHADEILQAGNPIYAGPILALQKAINNVYATCNVSPGSYPFTAGVATGKPVLSVHLTDLRASIVNVIKSINTQNGL